MPETIVHSKGWTAKILESESPSPDGTWHVYATVDGDTADLATLGTEHILNVYAKGRIAFIRAKPEIGVNRDFDCLTVRYVGFVRFSYRLETGEWTYLPPNNSIPGFGNAA
jgi:hypothetical protein